jgi:hypothetical protein
MREIKECRVGQLNFLRNDPLWSENTDDLNDFEQQFEKYETSIVMFKTSHNETGERYVILLGAFTDIKSFAKRLRFELREYRNHKKFAILIGDKLEVAVFDGYGKEVMFNLKGAFTDVNQEESGRGRDFV